MMQETRTMKKLMTALALATLAASSALAESIHTHASKADTGYSVRDPNVVVVDGQYVGRDPDPNIRFQLKRDPGLLAD
jgi:hypothetical protein